MKGLIARTWLGICGAAMLAGSGCTYWNFVDPCWPERYNYMARQEVQAGMAPQVQNGHVLDQTIWNYHFEPGTDKLTPGALEHLNYIARRRPTPDMVVYLQTAQDVSYDPAAPEKLGEARSKLDATRAVAIQKYLSAYTEGRHASFQVLVHDPGKVDMPAQPAVQAVTKMYAGSQGSLAGAGGK